MGYWVAWHELLSIQKQINSENPNPQPPQKKTNMAMKKKQAFKSRSMYLRNQKKMQVEIFQPKIVFILPSYLDSGLFKQLKSPGSGGLNGVPSLKLT